ncbi:MAG: AhpC/TSA family protein [Prevotella sp.]|nr:AhpC/TSA family protein [Prevotella sp.]
MKRLLYILSLTLVLVSCGTRSDRFKIEGRFLNLNQGEVYVYSPDMVITGVDTIKINGGRFSHELPCPKEGTLILVFPNYTEQPIFATPGKSVDVKADASHLKELTIKGTALNELMNKYRRMIINDTPPEVLKHTEMFIADHADSPVSVYLLKKNFLQTANPNYEIADRLLTHMIKHQPKNGELNQLKQQMSYLKNASTGIKLPSFSAYDLKGRFVSDADLKDQYALIYVWSTWSYDSQDIHRRVKRWKKDYGSRLNVLAINLDGSKRDCERYIQRDSLSYHTICDEQLFESPLIQKLGIRSVPDNILINESGRIIARSLPADELEETIRKTLK